MRYNIALRIKTHCEGKLPGDLEPNNKMIHSYLSICLWSSEDYRDGDIANIDQTALSFVLDGGKTYDIEVVKDVLA